MKSLILDNEKRTQVSILTATVIQALILLILSNILLQNKNFIKKTMRVVMQTSAPIQEKSNQNVTKKVDIKKNVEIPKKTVKKIVQKRKIIKKRKLKKQTKITKTVKKISAEQQLAFLLNNTKELKSHKKSNIPVQLNYNKKNIKFHDKTFSKIDEKIQPKAVIKKINNDSKQNKDDIDVDKQVKNILKDVESLPDIVNFKNNSQNDNIRPNIKFTETSSFFSTKNISISNNNSKIPGLLSNPKLDARKILRKGEHHQILLRVTIDNLGFVKKIRITKSSGLPTLDNLSKNHILKNWKWESGFNNSVIEIKLSVENTY